MWTEFLFGKLSVREFLFPKIVLGVDGGDGRATT